ncbi:MAG: response regulator transcription factor [Deltaproteobacteria bacterium]|nr:response regulator transcription factor [Deltaproteobacteria bacterium]MCW5808546.1 response regulator transcription factor [Deltaproteobacteria bacterium]
MRRILIVDDFALIRAGLRALLEAMPEVEVLGEAGNGAEALELIEQLHPDVVLMDISMPTLNGLEAIRRLSKLRAKPRVLVVSMHDEREYVRQALRAGAAGYLLKTADRNELQLAIATVARGESWLSPPVARVVIDEVIEHGDRPADELTPRQREVLQLIAEGHTTKDIARRLHVSVKTIETHRAQLMERLDIHHIAGLVRYALKAKIVSSDK